jgi:hypothetical protein
MVKRMKEAVPDAGTLPEPDQPIQTYRVPLGPDVGETTSSVMLDPESNQPLDGEGEPIVEEAAR